MFAKQLLKFNPVAKKAAFRRPLMACRTVTPGFNQATFSSGNGGSGKQESSSGSSMPYMFAASGLTLGMMIYLSSE